MIKKAGEYELRKSAKANLGLGMTPSYDADHGRPRGAVRRVRRGVVVFEDATVALGVKAVHEARQAVRQPTARRCSLISTW